MPYTQAKKTWKKLSHTERRDVTQQINWELAAVRGKVKAKGEPYAD